MKKIRLYPMEHQGNREQSVEVSAPHLAYSTDQNRMEEQKEYLRLCGLIPRGVK